MNTDTILQTRERSSRIRRKFIRNLVILIFLTVAAIIALVWVQGEKNQARSYQQLIKQRATLADESINLFFKRVGSSVTVLKKWGQSGLLSLDDIQPVTVKLIPILGGLVDVSSVLIAKSSGRFYVLSHDGNGWLSRLTDPNEKPGIGQFTHWQPDGMLQKQWEKPLERDALQREWYLGAVEAGNAGQIYWTPPYQFLDEKTIGITASASWFDEATPDKIQVVAFDIVLDDLSHTLSRLQVSDDTRVFLFDSDGNVLTATDKHDATKHSSFTPSNQLDDATITQSISVLYQKGGENREDPISFELGKQRWWADSYPIGPKNLGWKLGIVTPESAFFVSNQKSYYIFTLLVAAILSVSVFLIIILTRRYTYQIQKLRHRVIHRDNLAQDILNLIKAGEDGTLEFKSTLRQNLKSGKPGKEIEIAWLKTVVAYLNTEGGFLLFGVSDEGEILGMEADLFLNDDHCLRHFKNLIHQHIGIEFAKMIHFDLIEIEGKVVGLVDCNPADEPAFLFNKDSEDFYVRSGPATIKLTSKKMLKYLEDRKRDV